MIRLAVSCPAEQAEVVLAALLELAPAGVEQIDHGALTEFAIYGAPGEVPDLGDQDADVGGVRVGVRSTEVADDWAERWKEFHRPVEIGERVCVRPPWADPAEGLEDIVIDPGRAFGTAAHPTTRMCCELLLEAADGEKAEGALADLGSGTGVLAILAVRLGWAPVIAVDYDAAAIEAMGLNAAANGVEVEVQRIDLRREAPPATPAVVANLTADLLRRVAAGYADHGATPELVICSGITEDQVEGVVGAFADAGLGVRARLTESGWAALALDPN